MSTHDKILELIDRRWIDMGGGRTNIAKRKLPPQANDPSPCVFVKALPTDVTPDDLGTQFIAKLSKHASFGWEHVPTRLAWIAFAPSGERFFICLWPNWNKRTVPLLQEFCKSTGRLCGELQPDRTVAIGSDNWSFFDFKMIHVDEIEPSQRTIKRPEPTAVDVVALAKKLLRGRKPAREELASEEFRNDDAAHKDQLHDRLRRKFVQKHKAAQKKLAAEYGSPTKIGADDTDDVPVNGVFQFAVWKMKSRVLYLAAHNEDVDLPYALVLGTT